MTNIGMKEFMKIGGSGRRMCMLAKGINEEKTTPEFRYDFKPTSNHAGRSKASPWRYSGCINTGPGLL